MVLSDQAEFFVQVNTPKMYSFFDDFSNKALIDSWLVRMRKEQSLTFTRKYLVEVWDTAYNFAKMHREMQPSKHFSAFVTSPFWLCHHVLNEEERTRVRVSNLGLGLASLGLAS